MKSTIYLLLLSTTCWAQSGNINPADSSTHGSNNIIPNEALHPSAITVIPPSPEAASLGKYGEVPVSLYTGLPAIQIPLFTINQGPLTLTTAINYHAGGVKIDEIASSVGLNWSLSSGGVITRTIHGNPDDQVGGFQTPEVQALLAKYLSGTMTTTERQIFEHDVADGLYDTEPDEYFYNFLGNSGRMVFDQTGNPLLLNHTKMKLSVITNGFKIIDEAGTEYYFTEQETVKPTTYCQGKTPTYTAISGWWLTEIKPLKGKSIQFHYLTCQDVTYSQGINEQHSFVNQIPPIPDCQERHSYCTSVYRGDMKLVDFIYFDQGQIAFTYERRADLSASARRLRQMEVRNSANLLIKQFQFDYEYGGTSRFVLTQLRETTAPALEVPTHTFDYSHFQDLPPRNSRAQDHWGYYNSNSATTMIPPISLLGNPTGYTWADREPDAERSTYGLLSRITYPTKGFTDFVYEAHDYGYIFSNEAPLPINLAGGVRIKQVINRAGNPDQSDQVKTYEYRMSGFPNRSSGCLVQQFVYQFDFSNQNLRSAGPGEPTTTYTCSFIEATSNSQAYLGATQGGHVGYEEVTVYYHQDKQTGGKTWHKFSSFRDAPDTYLQGSWNNLPFPPPTSKDEYRGREIRTIDYQFANGIFSKVREKEYIYSFAEPAQVNGIKMRFALRSFAKEYSSVASNTYGYLRVWTKLDKEIETLSETNGSIIQTSNYSYSPAHLQLVEKRTTSSKGDIQIIRNKYPLDFPLSTYSSPTSEVIALSYLQDKNAVNALIEQTESVIKNGTSSEQVVRSLYQSYKNDQSGLRDAVYELKISAPLTNWQPANITSSGQLQKNAGYEEVLKFDLYDQYGNILQQHETNKMITSYGWGYNSTLPIIEAKNISYSALLQSRPNGFADLDTDSAIQSTIYSLQQSNPAGQIKGFTYIPLRGVSSQIDINGLSTYFVFDNLNRLEQIKNNKQQIVKEYKYHYKP